MRQAFGILIWFLGQCVTVGGLGMPLFLVPFVLLMGGMAWIFLRTKRVEYWKYLALLVLPSIWLFVGLWGGLFWLHWEQKPLVRNPDWVLIPTNIGLWVFLAASLGLVVWLRGLRWFTVLFAALNLYFMLGMTVLSGMAITGEWL